MTSIEGDAPARSIEVVERFGLWRLLISVEGADHVYSGNSLESVLGKATPTAPESWVHHTAELLDSLLKVSV
jgi:hypothetical protein